MLTASYDGTAKLWDAATGVEIRTFGGHGFGLSSAVFSHDGENVLAGSIDGVTTIWDVDSGGVLRQFAGHSAPVHGAALSPDGTTMLTGSGDNKARLWDVSDGAVIRGLSGHADLVYSVAFSPDGTQALTGSGDGTAILWDVDTGSETRRFAEHGGSVWSVAFSPDGTQIVTGSSGHLAARVWNRATGALQRTLGGYSVNQSAVSSAVFSPDGSHVLTAGGGTFYSNGVLYEAVLWNVTWGLTVRKFGGFTRTVNAVAFSPDGASILVGTGSESGMNIYGGTENNARIYETGTAKWLQTFAGHRSYVKSVTFSPDGTKVLTGSSDRTAILWSVYGSRLLRIFSGHGDGVNTALFTPDGNKVLTASLDGTARLWDATTPSVPDVVGETQEMATEIITNSGLAVGTVTQAYSLTVPAGLVASQTPPAGSAVLPDSAVDLVISLGAISVPNVVALPQAAADAILTNALLAVGAVTRVYSITAAKDSVISQQPVADTPVLPDTPVDLVVSRGGIAVPDLVARTREAAEASLAEVVLAVGTVTSEYSLTIPVGCVISQTPVSGTEVLPDTRVDFVTSLGALPVPNVVGQPQNAAMATIAAAGMTTGGVTQEYSPTVPLGSVVSQAPPAGTPALPGSAVNLVVSNGPEPVSVPNVVGQSETTAASLLAAAGLNTGTVALQCSNRVAAGLVISQSPAAAELALSGSPVSLVVSTGPCTVIVPDVTGKTQATAAQALRDAMLIVGTVLRHCSATIPSGLVISQDPRAGEPLPPGSTVALVVSTGACTVTVPNVAGIPLATAVSTLSGANLSAGVITRQCSDTAPAGFVISQDPAPEQQAVPGSTVALRVSSGPCTTTVPDLTGYTQAEAEDALAGAWLTVGQASQQCSNTVPRGKVISQDPAAGSHAEAGAVVSLGLSSGPCTPTVPNLVGQPALNVGMTLSSLNLTMGTVTAQCNSTLAQGQIVGQDPPAGTQAVAGDAVNVIVSTGSCGTAPPTREDLLRVLEDGFEAVDGNGDGQVSFFEAQIALADLARSVFNSVDTNGDGQISRAEAGLDGNSGCMGCRGGKGAFPFDALRKSFGNLFLGGLSLMALRVFGKRRMQ